MESKITNVKNNKKEKNDKLILILGAIVLVVILLYMSITSIYTLVGSRIMSENIDTVLADPSGSHHFTEGKVYYGYPSIGSVEHSINGIIPTGTEYYYVVFSKDKSSCMVVKAKEDWDRDYFPDFYNEEGVTISGQIKEMDYNARNFFSSFLNHYKMTNLKYSTTYIDLTAEKNSYFGVLASILITVGSVICFLAAKNKITNSRIIIAGALAIFAGIIFAIIYL